MSETEDQMERISIPEGATGRAVLMVGPSDTAKSQGSGDVEVLATPRLLALCEEAAVSAVSQFLPNDKTTVGARAEIDHLAPSWTGAVVEAVAKVVGTSGHRIQFQIEAKEGDKVVGRCSHTRVIVERARFERDAG
jgi:fluoroacetyl-CoA thioesterase